MNKPTFVATFLFALAASAPLQAQQPRPVTVTVGLLDNSTYHQVFQWSGTFCLICAMNGNVAMQPT